MHVVRARSDWLARNAVHAILVFCRSFAKKKEEQEENKREMMPIHSLMMTKMMMMAKMGKMGKKEMARGGHIAHMTITHYADSGR